jgi:uncharacterized protein YggE
MTRADDDAPPPVIEVPGVGRTTAAPDVARVRLAATALRPSAAEAIATAEESAARIRAACAGHGVSGADAATVTLSVQAEQVWDERLGGQRQAGFRCSHDLLLTVRDLSTVGAVLGGALGAGGDDVRLDGVDFGLLDDSALRSRARELAWQDAVARATQLAGLAGRELGTPVAVHEAGPSSGGFPLPAAVRMMGSPPGYDVAVQPGEVGATVTLTVRWVLG